MSAEEQPSFLSIALERVDRKLPLSEDSAETLAVCYRWERRRADRLAEELKSVKFFAREETKSKIRGWEKEDQLQQQVKKLESLNTAQAKIVEGANRTISEQKEEIKYLKGRLAGFLRELPYP